MKPRRHRWATDKKDKVKSQCLREDCKMIRLRQLYRGKIVRTYKRGNKVILYGILGLNTPPCGPPTEGEW